MEVLYVIIALHAENKQAFTAELRDLFPFASIEFVDYKENPLLLLAINIDEICWTNFDVSVLFLDDKIASFSRTHPYLKIGVVNKIGQVDSFFYDGYIMKNRQIVFEHAELYRGYIPVLQQLIETYDDSQAPLFSALFSRV